MAGPYYGESLTSCGRSRRRPVQAKRDTPMLARCEIGKGGTKRGSPRVDGKWRENPPPLSGFAAGAYCLVTHLDQLYRKSKLRSIS